jgi:hypothetical protein
MLMFLLWLLATVWELGLHYEQPNKYQRIGIGCVIALLAFSLGGVLAADLNGYTVVFALLTGYRILNIFRMVQAQMHERYLRRVTRSTFWVLTALQAGFAGLWILSTAVVISHWTLWAVLGGLQLGAGLIALLSVLRTLRRTAWPRTHVHFSDKELPSITVAIPARNETNDLQTCLQSILASDYPKLEVLVLDDCSQLKRTPEIIRSFAHRGVRFLQGREPGKTWLAKNWAYEQLAQEATGDYILFCGVDARLSPQSLRHFITVMLERKKTLISILPERAPEVYGVLSLIQPMRYYWELVPPRRLFNRPPVLSTCWMIEADALHKAGGFRAVSRAIVPEAYFAKIATKTDQYSFLRSNELLGITTVKQIQDQRETALRMRYPQVHRRPEQVAILSLVESGLLIMPFVMAVLGFIIDIGTPAHVLSILAAACLTLTHELVAVSTRSNSWWFGLLAAPWMFALDIVYMHYSMWRYEFSTVEWKGRNVCIPVMHVVPHLPSLPEE